MFIKPIGFFAGAPTGGDVEYTDHPWFDGADPLYWSPTGYDNGSGALDQTLTPSAADNSYNSPFASDWNADEGALHHLCKMSSLPNSLSSGAFPFKYFKLGTEAVIHWKLAFSSMPTAFSHIAIAPVDALEFGGAVASGEFTEYSNLTDGFWWRMRNWGSQSRYLYYTTTTQNSNTSLGTWTNAGLTEMKMTIHEDGTITYSEYDGVTWYDRVTSAQALTSDFVVFVTINAIANAHDIPINITGLMSDVLTLPKLSAATQTFNDRVLVQGAWETKPDCLEFPSGVR